jgi:hypothetical protein
LVFKKKVLVKECDRFYRGKLVGDEMMTSRNKAFVAFAIAFFLIIAIPMLVLSFQLTIGLAICSAIIGFEYLGQYKDGTLSKVDLAFMFRRDELVIGGSVKKDKFSFEYQLNGKKLFGNFPTIT